MTGDMTMAKIEFHALDSTGKRAIFWLAEEAETLTSMITGAAAHIGEVFEAIAFIKENPKGSAAHAILASRLQLGGQSKETILACIERAAPAYRSIVDRPDIELDELLADLRRVPGC
jgi:hypothetical protein